MSTTTWHLVDRKFTRNAVPVPYAVFSKSLTGTARDPHVTGFGRQQRSDPHRPYETNGTGGLVFHASKVRPSTGVTHHYGLNSREKKWAGPRHWSKNRSVMRTKSLDELQKELEAMYNLFGKRQRVVNSNLQKRQRNQRVRNRQLQRNKLRQNLKLANARKAEAVGKQGRGKKKAATQAIKKITNALEKLNLANAENMALVFNGHLKLNFSGT